MRHHGTIARIELEPAEINRIASKEMRNRIIEIVKENGFAYCTIDLEGYRKGSMDIEKD